MIMFRYKSHYEKKNFTELWYSFYITAENIHGLFQAIQIVYVINSTFVNKNIKYLNMSYKY